MRNGLGAVIHAPAKPLSHLVRVCFDADLRPLSWEEPRQDCRSPKSW